MMAVEVRCKTARATFLLVCVSVDFCEDPNCESTVFVSAGFVCSKSFAAATNRTVPNFTAVSLEYSIFVLMKPKTLV
jgi:hypothetical protein